MVISGTLLRFVQGELKGLGTSKITRGTGRWEVLESDPALPSPGARAAAAVVGLPDRREGMYLFGGRNVAGP